MTKEFFKDRFSALCGNLKEFVKANKNSWAYRTVGALEELINIAAYYNVISIDEFALYNNKVEEIRRG